MGNTTKTVKIIISLLVVGFILPFVGLLVDFIWPKASLFSRSGALMVACSVSLVYYNHFVGRDVKAMQGMSDVLGRLPSDVRFVIESNLNSLSLDTQSAIQDKRYREIVTKQAELNASYDALHSISKIVVRSEFLLGVLGTIIWGLGDIFLFKIVTISFLIFYAIPTAWTIVKFIRKARLHSA